MPKLAQQSSRFAYTSLPLYPTPWQPAQALRTSSPSPVPTALPVHSEFKCCVCASYYVPGMLGCGGLGPCPAAGLSPCNNKIDVQRGMRGATCRKRWHLKPCPLFLSDFRFYLGLHRSRWKTGFCRSLRELFQEDGVPGSASSCSLCPALLGSPRHTWASPGDIPVREPQTHTGTLRKGIGIETHSHPAKYWWPEGKRRTRPPWTLVMDTCVTSSQRPFYSSHCCPIRFMRPTACWLHRLMPADTHRKPPGTRDLHSGSARS